VILLHRRAPTSEVERVAAPSREAFFRDWVEPQRPVVVTGVVDTWPAFERWTPQFFKEKHGHLITPVAKLHDRHVCRDPNVGFTYEDVEVRHAVDLVYGAPEPRYYMIAPLEGPLAALFEDVRQPEYLDGAARVRSRFWMSAAGTFSPLHRDFPDNLFAQVVGRKRFTILHRREARRVYRFSMLSKLPQISPVDAENPDLDRYPRFRGAQTLTVDLNPGELLYLPSAWWHQATSVDASMSINWWWARGIVRVLAEAADLWRKLRNVRM
jgi:lysine-specific demethylase 8